VSLSSDNDLWKGKISMPVFLSRLPMAAGLILAGSLAVSGNAFAQAQPAAPKPAQQAPAAPTAPAQQQQQPAPQPGAPQQSGPQRVELQGIQPDWVKVCGKDPANNREVCYITRDFGIDPSQGPVLAVAIYDVKGDDVHPVRFVMPFALMIKPGIRFVVDKGPAFQEGSFEICMPNGCFAEAKVKTQVIDTLKKGTTLSLVAKNQVNNEITFVMPLTGFGKAFDGPAIDPKVLQDALQKKAEEMQKAVEQQQGGAAPAQPKQ
jgi:invasion protein IalB